MARKSIDGRLAQLEKRQAADTADPAPVVVIMRDGCEPSTPADEAELDRLCTEARQSGLYVVEWPPEGEG
jgi:hypothetical protein